VPRLKPELPLHCGARGGLAVIGTIINFAFGRPAIRLIGCAGAFLTVSALWRLVVAMM